MKTHRVRWAECDMHGHMNHAAYLVLFEDLRVAHWESLGQSFRPNSVGPVVGRLNVRYLKALAFGDEITLHLRVVSLRRTSFIHEYVVERGGERVFECEAVLVCVDNATGASIPIPSGARVLMIERDGAAAA